MKIIIIVMFANSPNIRFMLRIQESFKSRCLRTIYI